MKTKKRNWVKKVFLLISCLGIFMPIVARINTVDSVDFSGSWIEGERSIKKQYPISATYDTSFLYIESISQRSDITVRVLKNTETILEKNVKPGELPMMILISSLQDGSTYTLELTNQWGDRLVGEFIKR